MMLMLADNAKVGELRVFCATHSELAMQLAAHPNVQVIDLDGFQNRIDEAKQLLSDPMAARKTIDEELRRLRVDCAEAIATDRGISGQGSFTAHHALSIPYPEAIKAPYGKEDCLERMHCRKPKKGKV